jgi:hypothetical protein
MNAARGTMSSSCRSGLSTTTIAGVSWAIATGPACLPRVDDTYTFDMPTKQAKRSLMAMAASPPGLVSSTSVVRHSLVGG